MSRQFGNLKTIPFSFFSPTLYKDVKHQWQGFGASYLFVLILVLSIFTSLLSHDIRKDSLEISRAWKKAPEVIIKNGQAYSADEQRSVIKNNHQKTVIIIDPSVTDPNLEEIDTQIFLAKHAIFTKHENGSYERKPYSQHRDVVFDPAHFEKMEIHLSSISAYVLYPFIVFFSYLLALFFSFILSIITKIIAFSACVSLTCSQAFRLAIVAATPPSVVSALLYFFGLLFQHPIATWGIATLCYLVFAISVSRTNSK